MFGALRKLGTMCLRWCYRENENTKRKILPSTLKTTVTTIKYSSFHNPNFTRPQNLQFRFISDATLNESIIDFFYIWNISVNNLILIIRNFRSRMYTDTQIFVIKISFIKTLFILMIFSLQRCRSMH